MIFLIVFLITSIIEITLFVVAGAYIGIGNTFLLILLTFILGIYTFKLATRSMKKSMENQRFKEDLAGNIGYIIGAVFLIIPGLFTDAIGLLLVIPFTRPICIVIFSETLLMLSGGFLMDMIISRLQEKVKEAQTKTPPTADDLKTEKEKEKENWKNANKTIIDADYKDVD